jgi:hypothetical protein
MIFARANRSGFTLFFSQQIPTRAVIFFLLFSAVGGGLTVACVRITLSCVISVSAVILPGTFYLIVPFLLTGESSLSLRWDAPLITSVFYHLQNRCPALL